MGIPIKATIVGINEYTAFLFSDGIKSIIILRWRITPKLTIKAIVKFMMKRANIIPRRLSVLFTGSSANRIMNAG